MKKTYSELISLPTFEERFEYLKLGGKPGNETFGFDRYLNQRLYASPFWKAVRDRIIVRDNGCDLGLEGYEIFGKIIVHHMNPINADAIVHEDRDIFDPEYLICVSHNTHEAIHFGDAGLLPHAPTVRRAGDTKLW